MDLICVVVRSIIIIIILLIILMSSVSIFSFFFALGLVCPTAQTTSAATKTS